MRDKLLTFKLVRNVDYPMEVLSSFKGENTKHIGIYLIRYKDVNEKNFWNVQRKVYNFIQGNGYFIAPHVKLGDNFTYVCITCANMVCTLQVQKKHKQKQIQHLTTFRRIAKINSTFGNIQKKLYVQSGWRGDQT